MEPPHLIAVGVVGIALFLGIAAIGYTWQTFWLPEKMTNSAPQRQNTAFAVQLRKQTPVYLTDISIISNFPENPLYFTATAVHTAKTLRYFIDYQPTFSDMPRTYTPERIRVPIGESADVVRNMYIGEIQLIASAVQKNADDSLFWGDLKRNCRVGLQNHVRLVIVGPDSGEQHYYFELIRMSSREQPFLILRRDELTWLQSWDTEDEAK